MEVLVFKGVGERRRGFQYRTGGTPFISRQTGANSTVSLHRRRGFFPPRLLPDRINLDHGRVARKRLPDSDRNSRLHNFPVTEKRGGCPRFGVGTWVLGWPSFPLKHPLQAAASLRQSNTPSYSTPNPSDDSPSRALPDWRACNSAFPSSFRCYTH